MKKLNFQFVSSFLREDEILYIIEICFMVAVIKDEISLLSRLRGCICHVYASEVIIKRSLAKLFSIGGSVM